MTLIDEIKNDKQQLEDKIAVLVRAFEDKYGCLKVPEITIGRHGNVTFNNYDKTFVKLTIKIEGIS